jgi:hypothetical protein
LPRRSQTDYRGEFEGHRLQQARQHLIEYWLNTPEKEKEIQVVIFIRAQTACKNYRHIAVLADITRAGLLATTRT